MSPPSRFAVAVAVGDLAPLVKQLFAALPRFFKRTMDATEVLSESRNIRAR
jgi:hypothetical protein